MKLSLDASPGDAHPSAAALRDWYASRPMVRRVWALERTAESAQMHPVRVIVVIDPTPDGDETSPTWIANGHAWAGELRESMGREVALELLEPPLDRDIEIDGDGDLVAAQCWRESHANASWEPAEAQFTLRLR